MVPRTVSPDPGAVTHVVMLPPPMTRYKAWGRGGLWSRRRRRKPRKSKEIAAEASKKADEIKTEALKKADQLKTLAEGISPQKIAIPSISLAVAADSSSTTPSAADLDKFGITDDLREFVKGITQNTFQDFPMEDNPETSDVSMVANVRRDLNEWQEKHANLVLSTVKEISKLRYQLCPRHMTDRKFWKIYFILVNTHVAPFHIAIILHEKLYMEELKLKSAEKGKTEKMMTMMEALIASLVMRDRPKGSEPIGYPVVTCCPTIHTIADAQ
ncbi:hypothetical protein Sjap_015371 [Stephania japonica]|uniref:BSD domain-containing protein n=1 Tax=Stephania japonica TaxID=461633 RepID=A0AAP0NSF8_9MAGN